MARCTHCGKVNRDDSLFCQECGQRLEPPKPVSVPSPMPAMIACGSCGAANSEGMKFCKMCGTPLARPAAVAVPVAVAPAPIAVAPAPAPAAASEKQSCSACGKQTPAGFAFCQHCGRRFNSTEARNLGVASTMAADASIPGLTPPAGMPAAKPRSAQDEAWASTVAASASPAAPYVAAPSAPAAALEPEPVVASPAPVYLPVQSTPIVAASNGRNNNSAATARAIADPPLTGRLVPLNRDGSAGRALPLHVGSVDVGHTEGDLCFNDDPFLSDPHGRIVSEVGSHVCHPLDVLNGVYLRLRTTHVLVDGDTILIGRQLLRFDVVSLAESMVPAVIQHGVRRFGSIDRAPWGRLRQLSAAGTTLDVWHLTRAEMVLGREEGDITFPDDEFMSRRHVIVRQESNRFLLDDPGSSNGTFVRLREPTPISVGDVLRMGDQLLRLES